MSATEVKKVLQTYASSERAKINAWFFKTGKGQYGEGDEFIGVTVPNVRIVAKQFVELSFPELEKLLSSKKHEHRLTALLILVLRYKKAEVKTQKEIVRFYLAHFAQINNWDLVDLSAPKILGMYYCQYGGEEKLIQLAKQKNLWKKRVGIVATYTFIQNKRFELTLHIAEILLHDKEDLIHKAVGWMLREVGKKDVEVLRTFLTEHYVHMPRTMLRYAIERFPAQERKIWLKK
jgi:3-methyladenine DNA glycosylase AlkD